MSEVTTDNKSTNQDSASKQVDDSSSTSKLAASAEPNQAATITEGSGAKEGDKTTQQ